jgi:hypothetical protein
VSIVSKIRFRHEEGDRARDEFWRKQFETPDALKWLENNKLIVVSTAVHRAVKEALKGRSGTFHADEKIVSQPTEEARS